MPKPKSPRGAIIESMLLGAALLLLVGAIFFVAGEGIAAAQDPDIPDRTGSYVVSIAILLGIGALYLAITSDGDDEPPTAA